MKFLSILHSKTATRCVKLGIIGVSPTYFAVNVWKLWRKSIKSCLRGASASIATYNAHNSHRLGSSPVQPWTAMEKRVGAQKEIGVENVGVLV